MHWSKVHPYARHRRLFRDKPELVGHYERSGRFASCTIALGHFSELLSGLRGADEPCRCAEGVAVVLGRELSMGYQLEFNVWKLKPALLKKMKRLDAYVERCV